MRTNKVKEKNKHGNQVISRIKGRKALFSFIPSFELLVKALNKIVRNIIFKAFNSDMLNALKE